MNEITCISGLNPDRLSRLHTLELRGNKLTSTAGLCLPNLKNLFLVRILESSDDYEELVVLFSVSREPIRSLRSKDWKPWNSSPLCIYVTTRLRPWMDSQRTWKTCSTSTSGSSFIHNYAISKSVFLLQRKQCFSGEGSQEATMSSCAQSYRPLRCSYHTSQYMCTCSKENV